MEVGGIKGSREDGVRIRGSWSRTVSRHQGSDVTGREWELRLG